MDPRYTYLSVQGRIGRLHFAAALALLTLVSLAAGAVGAALLRAASGPAAILLGLAMLGLFGLNVWAVLALYAKRLHDVGVSGWGGVWILGLIYAGGGLLPFAPRLAAFLMLVGALLALALALAPGDRGDNAWGGAERPAGYAAVPAE